jgi:ribosomal protein L11 methyltransferase
MKRKRPNSSRTSDWRSGISAIDVGQDLRIVPYWEIWDTRADKLNIISDPGPAFGGSNHPTTIMALEFIETVYKEASESTNIPDLLDIGTGAGILAITASALGAGLSVGVDPDPVAIYAAKRNTGLNKSLFASEAVFPKMIIGDVSCVGKPFDIVVANLIGPLLIRIHSDLERLVKSTLILSGIGDHIRDRVIETYMSKDLALKESKRSQGWNAAILKR